MKNWIKCLVMFLVVAGIGWGAYLGTAAQRQQLQTAQRSKLTALAAAIKTAYPMVKRVETCTVEDKVVLYVDLDRVDAAGKMFDPNTIVPAKEGEVVR